MCGDSEVLCTLQTMWDKWVETSDRELLRDMAVVLHYELVYNHRSTSFRLEDVPAEWLFVLTVEGVITY